MSDVGLVVAKITKGGGARPNGHGGYMVKCPGHPDDKASLSISPGTDQPVVLRCFAECTTEHVLEAAGMTMADLCNPVDPRLGGETFGGQPIIAVYDYVDEHGDLIWQVIRTSGKLLRPRRRDATQKSGWDYHAPEAKDRVLYRLPKVIQAIKAGQPIWYVEGEKDVQSMERAGVVATTAPFGASSWLPHYSDTLRGADVTIVADRDDGGRALARKVRAAVIEVEGRARIVEAEHGKDATDHLTAGGTLETFVETVPYEEEAVYEMAPTLDEYLDNPPGEQRFVVPELLAEREVVIVTAGEGAGKTTLMKQFAVMVAAGLHPFTSQPIPQRRVLFIDLENPKHDNFADFAALNYKLRRKSVHSVGDHLRVLEARAMDVRSPDGLSWLLERVHAHKPDLLIVGPIYNMVGTDLKDENEARALKNAIDLVRERYGCAVMMEHHAPHRSGDYRDLRPIGSSLLMRWPAFGFGLLPILAAPEPGSYLGKPTGIYELLPWRGARRRSRRWPEHLRQGSATANSEEWPWEPADPIDVQQARALTVKR